jgi:AraC-like DNA-binding protein
MPRQQTGHGNLNKAKQGAGRRGEARMTAPLSGIPVLRFSTDELPERDRLPTMREVYGRLMARLDIEPVRDTRLHFQVVARVLPGLIVSTSSKSPVISKRTRELLADGNDDVILAVSPAAGNVVAQVGRELVSSSGEANLFSAADVVSMKTVVMPHCLNISLRRRQLLHMVPDLEDRFMRPIPGSNDALRLLTGYVGLLDDHHALTTPELRRLVVNHVYDLVALTLGTTRDAAEAAKNGGMRAARLHAIKADILAGLSQPGFTLAALAVRHGVSPRYVQMLFESEGTTFSRFLLDQRLERAHRMLSDPRLAERAIIGVATAAGFGDLSYFNRAFRRRYGETPSDVRAGSRQVV